MQDPALQSMLADLKQELTTVDSILAASLADEEAVQVWRCVTVCRQISMPIEHATTERRGMTMICRILTEPCPLCRCERSCWRP
jgi:hypothetical protein